MSIIIFIIVFITILLCYKVYSDKQWHKKPLQNFPFIHKGKVFWYSRSVATTLGVFCYDENNKLCVLANKRGQGTPDYQGYWNIVCGYLEHGVTAEENCQKEVFEETGLFIPLDKIHFHSINTEPTENKQNVSLRYVSLLDGVCSNYELSIENCEKDEVEKAMWIPIDEVGDYVWAFNHNKLINKMVKKISNNIPFEVVNTDKLSNDKFKRIEVTKIPPRS